jgi:hypothetical protein
LVLPHQDPGETIRVRLRLTIGIGELIELAKCLPKGLPNLPSKDAFAPGSNFLSSG